MISGSYLLHIGIIGLFAFVCVFLLKNMYIALRDKKVTVKGKDYTKEEQANMYWRRIMIQGMMLGYILYIIRQMIITF